MPITPRRAEDLAALLRVLADPTRLSMLAALREADAPVCICDFTAAYGLSQPTISHHMAKLKEAGLVRSRREGVWVHYSLARPLPAAVEGLLGAAEVAGDARRPEFSRA